jgi:hypothetical protein
MYLIILKKLNMKARVCSNILVDKVLELQNKEALVDNSAVAAALCLIKLELSNEEEVLVRAWNEEKTVPKIPKKMKGKDSNTNYLNRIYRHDFGGIEQRRIRNQTLFMLDLKVGKK